MRGIHRLDNPVLRINSWSEHGWDVYPDLQLLATNVSTIMHVKMFFIHMVCGESSTLNGDGGLLSSRLAMHKPCTMTRSGA